MLESLGKKLPTIETVIRVLENLCLAEPNKKPIVTAYYPTYNCNMRCGFCSQSVHAQDENASSVPDLDKQLHDLELIREGCPNIYFVGGEPTMHGDILKLLAKCAELDFDVIGFNTNGVKFVPEIFESINMLVFSLHSTDPLEISRIYGYPSANPALGNKVLENLKKYAEAAHRYGIQMTVNTVVTGDNVSEILKIADLCKQLGIKFNIAPAVMQNGRPDEKLRSNVQIPTENLDPRLVGSYPQEFEFMRIVYHKLIDLLIAEKGLMASSVSYLKAIQKLGYFKCVPNLVPGVDPNGDVIVPCPNLPKNKCVNMSEHGGLNEAIRFGRKNLGEFDPGTDCVGNCHKTCYLEASSISTITDLVNRIRAHLGFGLENSFNALHFEPEEYSPKDRRAVDMANLFIINEYPFRDAVKFNNLERFPNLTIGLLKMYFTDRIFEGRFGGGLIESYHLRRYAEYGLLLREELDRR